MEHVCNAESHLMAPAKYFSGTMLVYSEYLNDTLDDWLVTISLNLLSKKQINTTLKKKRKKCNIITLQSKNCLFSSTQTLCRFNSRGWVVWVFPACHSSRLYPYFLYNNGYKNKQSNPTHPLKIYNLEYNRLGLHTSTAVLVLLCSLTKLRVTAQEPGSG